jgi:exopolyphosphatase/guanosine-5'-triphosphate,3'-diphosphate pyrophosphatase
MKDNGKYAVIDLGTNTFHLLAVEQLPDHSFRRLHKERIYVRLAENGIAKIGEAPFQRGVAALGRFKEVLEEHGICKVRAFGTAALRTASNGPEFVRAVKEGLGIHVETIPGQEEARLIHQGVMQAIGEPEGRFMIMDIGGGSVEFIIADKDEVYWRGSFPLGVAVLRGQFHHQDPISDEELRTMGKHLDKVLASLFQTLREYPAHTLVGASGTFDVLAASLPSRLLTSACVEVEAAAYPAFHRRVVGSTTQQRLDMEDIPDMRVEMIVVALELIRHVIERAGINKILISAYAMKEGILKEFLEN